MASHYVAQVAVWYDSTLPRDAEVINPCFRDNIGGTDAGALANDLATAVSTAVGTAHQVRVRFYDLQGTKPVRPAGEKLLNSGNSGASTTARELALCLSFYGGSNQPRNRGRLYIPANWLGISSVAVRPTIAQQQQITSYWPSVLSGLGGANIDWIVWSRRNSAATKVDHYFVDNEWDIQRRRGLRSTAREAGTISG
jgi:hypothetical protein